jgi:selenide,water dikinase
MADLAYVLRHLPHDRDPNLVVGPDMADDAAVYRLSDELALVQTVDFFTPIVDDPFTYGQIAAANSLSDVYAVGGRPLTALNIVGFPINSLPADVLGEILRGGAQKAAEAGVTIVGGHTIDDEEPKYGLAVTGTVHPRNYLSAHGALPGDALILTKPIGTGAVSTALKAGKTEDRHVRQAVRWMTQLNRAASDAALASSAHAVTDVTGYGLLGHLAEMCRASGVAAVVERALCPLLPGAADYVAAELVPGGTSTNLAALDELVTFDCRLDDVDRRLLADPQTSGGLLVALPPERVDAFRRASNHEILTGVIGRIEAGTAGRVRVIP